MSEICLFRILTKRQESQLLKTGRRCLHVSIQFKLIYDPSQEVKTKNHCADVLNEKILVVTNMGSWYRLKQILL